MGRELAFYVPKGGVAKTTLSVHTAYVANEWGIPTMVVSVDRQGDAIQWLTEASVQDGRVYQAKGLQHVRVLYSPNNVPQLDLPLVILDLPPYPEAASWATPHAFGIPLDGRMAINDLFSVLPAMRCRQGGAGFFMTLCKADAAGKRFVSTMKQALAGHRGYSVWEPGIADNHAIKRSGERFEPAWGDPWARKTEGVTQLRSYCEFLLRQLGLGPVSGGGRKGLGR